MKTFNPTEKRRLIMKHYLNPINKVEKIKKPNTILFSQNCADKLQLEVNWNKNICSKAKFVGEGCAIFIASTDLMLSLILDKKINDIQEILENYNKMLLQKEEYNSLILQKLIIFTNVSQHYNRLECAQMIQSALKKLL